MTFSSFNIFIIIFTVYQSFIFHLSHGFEVIQPENQIINPDQSASISCRYSSQGTVRDVRLNRDSKVLCQKGMPKCPNIFMHEENPKEYVFLLLYIGSKEINSTYVCEFSVEEDGLDYIKLGNGTKLLQGEEKEKVQCPSSLPPLPLPAPSPLSDQLVWILIGLLACMFLYSFVITCCYIRVMIGKDVCEDPTYVEMRKAPLTRSMNSYYL